MDIVKGIVILLVLVAGFVSCDPEPSEPDGDLTHLPYTPSPYIVDVPDGFPPLEIPADNPMTLDGVVLGRMLFFDPILSIDSSMSCASCHLQNASFTDNLPVSEGVQGLPGKRSAMSLLNVGFYNTGLFWDGRTPDLEKQALLPVEDPLEMNAWWPLVVERLKEHPIYPEKFRKAFGIRNTTEIERDLAVKAIAQYERTLVSSGNSKFDRFWRGEIFLDDDEFDGYEMFFDTSPDLPDAECGHCHNAPLFTTNEYFNNGIQEVASLEDFPDLGLGAVTGLLSDNGKFRVPTLRNIVYTAPYMHDGRFETLEEVIDHYDSGGFPASNKNPLIRPLGLTDLQKDQLLAFIRTLSDTSFLQRQDIGNPFE